MPLILRLHALTWAYGPGHATSSETKTGSPSTRVSNTFASPSFPSSISNRLRSRTAMSASLPTSIEPVWLS